MAAFNPRYMVSDAAPVSPGPKPETPQAENVNVQSPPTKGLPVLHLISRIERLKEVVWVIEHARTVNLLVGPGKGKTSLLREMFDLPGTWPPPSHPIDMISPSWAKSYPLPIDRDRYARPVVNPDAGLSTSKRIAVAKLFLGSSPATASWFIETHSSEFITEMCWEASEQNRLHELRIFEFLPCGDSTHIRALSEHEVVFRVLEAAEDLAP